ncbi:MAG: response regulator [bacterium]
MAKILVIDDEPDIRKVVSRFLKNRGHQAVTASDGMFAMKKIREERPDLIILDILMPGLDGCALGHHLKFNSEFSKIPLMVLTSLGDKPYLGEEMAADYFMPKPFGGEKLVDKVEELLAGGRVRVGVEQDKKQPSKKRWKPAFLSLSTVFLLVLIAGSLLLLDLNSAESVESISTAAADRKKDISVIADQLFIYSLPVVIGILAYFAFVLNKMSRKESSRERLAGGRKIL